MKTLAHQGIHHLAEALQGFVRLAVGQDHGGNTPVGEALGEPLQKQGCHHFVAHHQQLSGLNVGAQDGAVSEQIWTDQDGIAALIQRNLQGLHSTVRLAHGGTGKQAFSRFATCRVP